MKVETVRGEICADELGITFCHEHLLVNTLSWFKMPTEASKLRLVNAPVTIENLGEIRRAVHYSKDNLVLDDLRLITEELALLKNEGGGAIVDVTSIGLNRDHEAVKMISELTGVNVILGTGWYVAASHPLFVKKASVEELKEVMVKDIVEGIGNTKIRAGIIGEVGASHPPLHPDEEKVIRAAARAQVETDVAYTIHPGTTDFQNRSVAKEGEKYLNIIESEGANLAKFYLSHAHHSRAHREYRRRLLDRGITLCYDGWGIEWYNDDFWPGHGNPSDMEKVEEAVELCQQGYDGQMVFSHDICSKIQLVKYGGYGYAHILKHIIPALRFRGVSEKQLRNILVENPKRLLSRSG